MIENKYLIEWVKANYPMMEIGSDSDLAELDYTDFEKFAEWLVKKLTIPDVSNQRELLTQFAVFMAKNIERGKTPASLVNDFYETLGQ